LNLASLTDCCGVELSASARRARETELDDDSDNRRVDRQQTETVMLVGGRPSSGLLIRALLRAQAVDPGFRTEGVLTLRTVWPKPRYAATEKSEQF